MDNTAITTTPKATISKRSKFPFKNRKQKSGYHKFSFKRDWELLIIFLLPGLIWYLMFAYKPMIGLRIAFYDFNVYKGLAGSKFVGLDNFVAFMSSPDFARTVINTIMIAVWQLAIVFPMPIFLAIAVTEIKYKWLSKLVQTATFLPYFISIVVVCGMVINFLSPSTGIVNFILSKLGFEPQYFMVKPEYFRPIYTFMTLWKTAGFDSIVYIAAIMGIDNQLYEAAKVDGAGKWQQLKNITIPGIMPIVVVMLVLNIGKMVKVGFESIILLYQPTTYVTADVIASYVYRTGLINRNYGVAAAAGIFEAVIALVLVVFANKLSKKISQNSVW